MTEARKGNDPAQAAPTSEITLDKLWLYTNFDCNLRCSYCITESTPEAPRRALGLANVQRLVDEAVALGFRQVFLTGGEPFLLPELFDMLAYSSARLPTTVLSNATLLRGKRLEALCTIANSNLSVQVSLDGGCPEHNDPYRGEGTWAKAVEGIKRLQECGIPVSVSTTETPANALHLDELGSLVRSLGIAEEDHFVRPLTRRGFATEGQELGRHNLIPEVTVTAGGIYWHPAIAPSSADMQVTEKILPLADAVELFRQELAAQDSAEAARTKLT